MFIAASIGIVLTACILVLVLRSKQKVRDIHSLSLSEQEQMAQTVSTYEEAIRAMQLEIQSSADDPQVLRDRVEAMLLTVRVPQHALQDHLAATITVRGAAKEGMDAAALVALLESLL